MTERLQKILSGVGLMSRRAAEAAIREGRVTVNGLTASLGDKADAEADQIVVDGRKLPSARKKIYIMLNKPRGYVTTLSDEKGRKNVAELVSGLEERVYPVGRLDLDSEGLLLMTNDGDFANAMAHPSHEVNKEYRTWVKGEHIADKLELLRSVAEIDGRPVHPAKVELLQQLPDGAILSITIHEGRNRQVRKMCEQVGLKVSRLRRVGEGGLSLGDLKTGCWRHLTEEELKQLRSKHG